VLHVLDTDHVSLLEWGESAEFSRLRKRLDVLPDEAVCTTITSYLEQTRGWLAYFSRAKSLAQQVEAFRRLSRHLDTYRAIKVLPFDEAAAAHFQRLKRSRIRISTMDLRIAAIALARDAVLLTRNRVDFERVPNLNFEDWTA
jgi:tRNA(fMet)-specific endonuclease VapC